MSFLIFDIETAPDLSDEGYTNWKSASLVNKTLKDPEKIAKDRADKIGDKFPLSYTAGKIITIGFLTDERLQTNDLAINNWTPQMIGDTELYYQMIALSHNTEAGLLGLAWRVISECYGRGDKLVGYNSRKFDIQMLLLRSMIHGIPRPNMFPSYDELTSEYRVNVHLDLFDVLNPNYGDFTSLSEWGYKIGATDSLSSDGHKVYGWYLAGDWSSIISHCLADLAVTYQLYMRAKQWLM